MFMKRGHLDKLHCKIKHLYKIWYKIQTKWKFYTLDFYKTAEKGTCIQLLSLNFEFAS